MRIYKGLYEAFKETERELFEMGILIHPQTMQDKDVSEDENYITKELQGYCFKITSQTTRDTDFVTLNGNIEYVIQELSDRMNVHWLNPGKAFRNRNEVWKEFLHKGKFAYTYNERFREQLPQIIEELKINPQTRQAIVTMYDRHQDINNIGGKARIPCSMYYQFLRRNREGEEFLDAIYTMRSCDLYTHFIYDLWLGMGLQEEIGRNIGIYPGHFTFFVGSLHAYKKDYKDKGVF